MSFHRDAHGEDGVVTGVISAGSLLRRPVRLRGIRLGRPTDLLLDVEAMRVVGLEVVCGDDARRFLPLAAARVREDEIAVGSALLLLEGDDVGFYRRRGLSLAALRGRRVVLSGRPAGVLRDVGIAPDGRVTRLVVELPHGRAPVRVDVPEGATLALAAAAAPAA